MKVKRIATRRWSLVATIVSLVALTGPFKVSAGGTSPSPTVVPPNAPAVRWVYSQLSAMWWQWMFSRPAVTDASGNNTNPQFDTTGAYSLAGQECHPVLLLPACWGGDVARTIRVPAGRMLFFPIANAWADVLGEKPVPTVPELYSRVKGWVDPTVLTDLYATLNGKSLVSAPQLSAFRFQSLPFAYFIPKDNFFALWGYSFPAQIVYPAISDGYWLLLEPLRPGHYVLAFGNRTWLNVTYDITVVGAGPR
jgi:hypothetical protein